MPHGRLTPLGKQLKAVLANLSPSRRVCLSSRPTSSRANAIRDFHSSSEKFQSTTSRFQPLGQDAATGVGSETRTETETFQPFGQDAATGAGSEARTETETFQPLGQDAATGAGIEARTETETFRRPKWERLTAPVKTDQLAKAIENEPIDAAAPAGLSLQGILIRYIQAGHAEEDIDPVQAQWERDPSFAHTLTSRESEYLRRRRYKNTDLQAWADIVLTADGNKVLEKLAKRMQSHKDDPLFILMHSLLREYIPASALRTVIQGMSAWLKDRERRGLSHEQRHNASLLIIVVRLLRHAREIWPQSMPAIVSLYLGVLQHQDAVPREPPESPTPSEAKTFALNKIMSLVSLSTALLPFKDVVFQETAIIRLLRYMDAHDPPVQITRPGYRAVARIQLAMRKTADEQQWAELKALSWPPWKVDRTAMDASVTLDYGISRARATLISMRNAGYKPNRWETAAEVYSGWNPDGTPTIQRRAMLGSPGNPNRDATKDAVVTPPQSATWAARIDCTRTIQEAWACYLAWEDAKLPPDDNVFLAIMQKLHHGGNASQHEQQEMTDQQHEQEETLDPRNPAWDLFPGDTPKLSPLPPSTHLYTYTRTPIPSLDAFYESLRDRGVPIRGHCLAFLLRYTNPSLNAGLSIIHDSLPQYPDLQAVLNFDPAFDVRKLPREIFTACVHFFAQSGGYFLDHEQYSWLSPRSVPQDPGSFAARGGGGDLVLERMDRNSVIVRAIELLLRRPKDCGRVTWVAAFQGLTKESNFSGLGQALLSPRPENEIFWNRGSPNERNGLIGAIVGYVLCRMLMRQYRSQFGDLDPHIFYRFCNITEWLVRAVWKYEIFPRIVTTMGLNRNLVEPTRKLRREFARLVGVAESGEEKDILLFGGENLPRLLHVPNPAMLHVYVRALGWLECLEGMKDLVYWMEKYKAEIQERAERDRAGRDMMRRAVVGIRVFLERSWSSGGERGGAARRNKVRDSLDEVRWIVDGWEEWGGWATDEEVERYVEDERFEGFREE